MARDTDTGKDISRQQLYKQDINLNVTMDETGTFFIDPYLASGEPGLLIEDLNYMISKHSELVKNYDKLMNYYRGNHTGIINQKSKDYGKPDNRILINYPKQLVNAYVGYFAGVNPSFSINSTDGVKETQNKANDLLHDFADSNDINHFYVQQAKYVDIFGRSYGLVYQNEIGETKLTTLDPRQGFIVYSNDVSKTPVFGVMYQNKRGPEGEALVNVYMFLEEYVTLGDGYGSKYINGHAYNVDIYAVGVNTRVEFEMDKIVYGRLPMVEFNANDEKMGLYQDLVTVFDAVDSAISEKKNDVDYFGDAILFINNMLLDKGGLNKLRDLRILMSQSADGKPTQAASFLDKPTADGTQENLINRLISSIYDVSGVVNLNDKDFTNAASGQALKQRLQGMRQNADTKASFFDRSFKNVFRCLFNGARMPEAINSLNIKLKKNEPLDILDESQALVNMTTAVRSGMVSQETALSNMSYIENPKDEMAKIKSERAEGTDTVEDIMAKDNKQ